MLEISIDYYSSAKNSGGVATALNNMATLDIKKGDYEKAKERIVSSINMHKIIRKGVTVLKFLPIKIYLIFLRNFCFNHISESSR